MNAHTRDMIERTRRIMDAVGYHHISGYRKARRAIPRKSRAELLDVLDHCEGRPVDAHAWPTDELVLEALLQFEKACRTSPIETPPKPQDVSDIGGDKNE